jgi:hypothetical protein
MDLDCSNAHRRSASTRAGEVAYADVGDGPVTVFVHGVLMSSFSCGTA